MSKSALRVLYERVDDEARRLARRHEDRLQCRRGCASCCVDGITVFEIEAERIRERHGTLLQTGVPHPAGGCAFLDSSGACRIYADRPYVCRTQGLPLRWLETSEHDGSITEYRDICPLNAEGEPPETIPASDCWTIGPVEGELARLQGDMRRTPLRSLFRAQ